MLVNNGHIARLGCYNVLLKPLDQYQTMKYIDRKMHTGVAISSM